jgi:hypothetical protein
MVTVVSQDDKYQYDQSGNKISAWSESFGAWILEDDYAEAEIDFTDHEVAYTEKELIAMSVMDND